VSVTDLEVKASGGPYLFDVEGHGKVTDMSIASWTGALLRATSSSTWNITSSHITSIGLSQENLMLVGDTTHVSITLMDIILCQASSFLSTFGTPRVHLSDVQVQTAQIGESVMDITGGTVEIEAVNFERLDGPGPWMRASGTATQVHIDNVSVDRVDAVIHADSKSTVHVRNLHLPAPLPKVQQRPISHRILAESGSKVSSL